MKVALGTCLSLVIVAFTLAGGTEPPVPAQTQVRIREPQVPRSQASDLDVDDETVYLELKAQRSMHDNCLICHEPAIISSQRLTPLQWKAEVEKMINWGAPLPEADRQPLVDFLSKRFSEREPATPLTTVRLADSGSLELPSRDEPVSKARGNAARGQRLYQTNCATCHGPEGLGGDLGPSLASKAILGHSEAYHKVVREGLRRMPGFVQILSRDQEDDLLAWVRGLSNPANRRGKSD